MTGPRTLSDAQAWAASRLGKEWVSAAEMQTCAERYGIGQRTLRRYESEGLIANPERHGRGRARGVEFLCPARALLELQLLAEARKTTHSVPRIRHWLWWAGYPVEWERWRADRIEELAGLAIGELLVSGMTQTQRDRKAAELSADLGKRRPYPLRRQALRTAARREQWAQWVVDAKFAGNAPDPEESLGGGPDATVGGALDRAVGLPLRLSLQPDLPPIGSQVAALLTAVPNFAECLRRFEELTEEEARDLWRIAVAFEALGLFGAYGAPSMRDAPTIAALMLVYVRWAVPRDVLGELAALAA